VVWFLGIGEVCQHMQGWANTTVGSISLVRAVHDGVVGHRVGEVADGMLGVFGMG
jgi:hypothetical protein